MNVESKDSMTLQLHGFSTDVLGAGGEVHQGLVGVATLSTGMRLS